MELAIQVIGYNGTRSAVMRAQRQQARLDAPDALSILVDQATFERLQSRLDEPEVRELLRSHIHADIADVLAAAA